MVVVAGKIGKPLKLRSTTEFGKAGREMRREKGTGSIYKRDGSPVWWIKYHRHGRPFRESTQTTDYNKAGKMLKTRLSEINQGTFMGPQLERTKVDELAVMFVRDYRINSQIGRAH